MPILVLLVILGLPFAWAAATYNALVRLRNQCREAWSGIDTELKRRYELIPNVVETVRGYAAHERGVLLEVIEARRTAMASAGTPSSQARDENLLVASIRDLVAVAEHYPSLKADRHFLALQRELADTEDRIQAARRFFNANVRDLNTRIDVFPSNLVAALFGFRREEYFELEDAGMRRAPDAAVN